MTALRIACFLLASAGAFAADDGWAKVQALDSGVEIRITKEGTKTPVVAKFDQATEENLIIATKTEQVAIPKAKILKIEYRPAQTGSRITRESKVENTPVDKDAARPSVGPARTPGPSGSSSSGITIGGKPDFQTVWTRGARVR